VASFVGGFRIETGLYDPEYLPREVEMIRSASSKPYHITIKLPEEAFSRDRRNLVAKKDIWEPIVSEIKTIVSRNRSTLVFVNSCKLCKKITYLVNRDEPYPLAYAHHGSLSRELRYTVWRANSSKVS
jgi:ATP-dependent Lhr-like helicase